MGENGRRWIGARITICEGEDGLAVYVTDRGRTTWRIYDVSTTRSGERHIYVPPEPQATHRAFVTQDGMRRIYTFRPKDRRDLEPRLLMAQLNAAPRVRRG